MIVFNSPAAMLMQHLLFVFLLIIAPAWDYYDTGRLKRNPTSQRKITYYRTLTAWLWMATALAIFATGFRALFFFIPAPGEIDWLTTHVWVRYLLLTVILLMAAMLLLPVVTIALKKIKKQPRKYSSADALQSLSFFLPATWVERRWFVFVCITAGICEEILFRGFLLRYLHVSAFRLNLTAALLISALIFGAQHLYLGLSGVLSSFVGGLIFGVLFLLTGSLLLPMIFHAASDLRMLLILRPPARVA